MAKKYLLAFAYLFLPNTGWVKENIYVRKKNEVDKHQFY